MDIRGQLGRPGATVDLLPKVAPMPLTNVSIRNAKPGPKARKLFDGRGLYLEISPRGRKWWRLKYRFEGREKRISLGVYPKVNLKAARQRLAEARKILASGQDPSAKRSRAQEGPASRAKGSFGAIARFWMEQQSAAWSAGHAARTRVRLEQDVFPWLGERPIGSIEPPAVLEALRRVEDRGAVETAHRIRSIVSQVFRFAEGSGWAAEDPARILGKALRPIVQRHHASLVTPRAGGALMRAIAGFLRLRIPEQSRDVRAVMEEKREEP